MVELTSEAVVTTGCALIRPATFCARALAPPVCPESRLTANVRLVDNYYPGVHQLALQHRGDHTYSRTGCHDQYQPL
jgi:hypothetical protein